ncbi:MAG: hypothetical protein IMZ64_02600 [Bacteroidetes bacterium]|nr:hypothetical protein [Bacteroidota bacterium]
MTTTTPILGLTLYDSTTDQAVLFATYRAQISGPATSSNLYKIDTEIGDIQTDITALQAFKGAIPVPAAYISANYYEATGITSITSYTSGTVIILSLDTTSSGTVTLNINSLGTKSVMKTNSAGAIINLIGTDLVINRDYLFRYDGTRWLWVSMSSLATGAEIDTGTDDIKSVTPKAIVDSAITTASKSQTFTNKTLGTTQLGEVSLKLDAALSADGTWSGITEIGTAGVALTFGDLCYFQTADSRWELFHSALEAAYNKKLGMCVLAAAGDGSATEMLLVGKIRADSKFPTLSIGNPVYGSENYGLVSPIPVVSSSYGYVRVVGYANTADELYFNPSPPRPHSISEIVLLRNAGPGGLVPGVASTTYDWPGECLSASTCKIWANLLSSANIIYARWVLTWNPHATSATVTGVRLVKCDDGPTNIEVISTVEEGSNTSPSVDAVDVTTDLQTILSGGVYKNIGHQARGDGSNQCSIYSSVIEVVWG